MDSSLVPLRHVDLAEAASFAGTTPEVIRQYHEIGLLADPERRGDDHRRYGYPEVIRLLWIRKMVDAGIALADIGDRMRADDARVGLLSDAVVDRLNRLPEGSLRQADLDTLLVAERIFGPLGAAVQASRFIVLAIHPELRQESDRVDAAEEALDDTVAVDDPRVEQVAADRHALELVLHAAIEKSGLAQDDEALFASWEAGGGLVSATQVVGKMPYDFSPARLRCLELAEELAAEESRVGE